MKKWAEEAYCKENFEFIFLPMGPNGAARNNKTMQEKGSEVRETRRTPFNLGSNGVFVQAVDPWLSFTHRMQAQSFHFPFYSVQGSRHRYVQN